ncbi:MAG: hypothetical protein ACMUJM_19215 [bacterium]
MKRQALSLLLIIFIEFIGLNILSCHKSGQGAESLAYLKEFAKAEVVIEHMRKQDNPNWNAIREQYNICSKLVKEVDEKNNTDYHKAIQDAIEKCAHNERTKVNQQTLAKGLQHIAVMKIRDLIGSMANADKAARKSSAYQISALFNGIRPTFTRRDKDFFHGKKQLEREADLALTQLKSNNEADYITAANRLENIINRTYALCVLYEMQSIEKLRATDFEQCDVKLAEAALFNRIIEPKIKKTDRRAHQTITVILNAEYSAVNSERLKNALNRGLSQNIL